MPARSRYAYTRATRKRAVSNFRLARRLINRHRLRAYIPIVIIAPPPPRYRIIEPVFSRFTLIIFYTVESE